jgi:hypothetical protein
MENLDELIWNSLFQDSTLFQEVKAMYKDGERQEVKLKLKDEIEQLEKKLTGLERKKIKVQEMVENEIMSIPAAKRRVIDLNNNTVEIVDKINKLKEQEELISNERRLIEDMRNDFPFLTGGDFHEMWNDAGFLLDADTVNEERIKATVGFNERQKIIKKYIDTIQITYIEENTSFKVAASFKLPISNMTLQLEHNLGRKPRSIDSKNP